VKAAELSISLLAVVSPSVVPLVLAPATLGMLMVSLLMTARARSIQCITTLVAAAILTRCLGHRINHLLNAGGFGDLFDAVA